jgi:leucyl aminopeptidase (aminopeptidase T)
MIQPNLDSIAEKTVSTCANVKRGDCVFIFARSDTAQFAEALGIACIRHGAHPVIQSRSDYYPRESLLQADEKTLGEPPRHFLALLKETDVFFQVGFLLEHPGYLRDVPPEKFAAQAAVHQQIQRTLYDGTKKWIGIACPSPGQADAFQIQWESYHDSMWNALDADYDELVKRCSRLEQVLQGKKTVQITTRKGTDITIDIEGAPILRDDGVIPDPGKGVPLLNLPSGEVYTVPVTAQGTVIYDYVFLYGTPVFDLKGEFKDGIVEFTDAKKGLDSVKKSLENAKGDIYKIAELGIGVNPDLTHHGNVIATEKMNGTVHLAIGDNRPMGGKNEASGHWDMFIFEPTVVVDGVELIKDGHFQVEGL